ncbi:hypothetical protein J2S34_003928 [Nitrobacter winogradskyi]|uniref:Uncharacterized protein n=1 Tax=Nitrobacter winogradskyi TaxID=913 RepID=A0ACC6APG4_NITWI|nr:hypothetical protein [Nitrobacter winogradskyi]
MTAPDVSVAGGARLTKERGQEIACILLARLRRRHAHRSANLWLVRRTHTSRIGRMWKEENKKGAEPCCRMPDRRVKGGFARCAALDPPDRRGGREGGV